MNQQFTESSSQADAAERRWPVIIAVLAAGGLYAALPQSLAVGPRWLQGAILAVLLVPTIITHQRGHHEWNQILGHLIAGVMTIFMIWSLVLLMLGLPAHKETPLILLRSAVALWITNILVFALWYWRLDGGGPHRRSLRGAREIGAFLFPQISLAQSNPSITGKPQWSPIFIDYLFLAFNTSTAFSPTDTAVLSRWAKVLTMLQSTISLCVVVILAARAVNIL
jgi:hypothetical protein